nr:alpha/beta hydrolase [Anaerolineae bacterium]
MAEFGIDRFATVEGYRIHYVELGEGHPLVLVPPSFATYRNWKKVAPAMAEHFRVLAVDYLGTGQSDKPKQGFLYSPQEQADIIAGLLDVLSIEWAHLMGVSYGGTIVLSFAGRHPERTGKVVSIEGYASLEKGLPEGWGPRKTWLMSAPIVGDLICLVVRTGLWNETFAREFSGAWWEDMTDEERQEWRDYIAGEVRYANRCWVKIRHAVFLMGDAELRSDVRRIRTPVLLLIGGRSGHREHIQPTLEFLRHEVPTARIVEVPDGIHDLEWQKPELVVREALDFLKEPTTPH